MRRTTIWCLLFASILACGKNQPPAETAPPPPKPPTEPVAWLPADASVVGRVSLEPFRGTPLWSIWTEIQRKEQPFTDWIDVNLVDEVALGGHMESRDQTSFVVAIRGRFGENYLAQLGAREQRSGVVRGLLTVYERPEAQWAQVSPELLLAFSPDRADAVVARASQGPGAPVRDGQLYRSLAERVGAGTADLVLLAEDPSGKKREALRKHGARYGVAPLADEVVRGAVSIDMGPDVVLTAVAETPDETQAKDLDGAVQQTITSLSRNLFVGLLGLRPVLRALKAHAQGRYVTVRGSVPEAELRAALSKISAVLEVAKTQGASIGPAP